MKHQFKAAIYKTGINWCVDVPADITQTMQADKGYIRIMGAINGFEFAQTLVPVKNGPYRLFVNGIMMKGGKTALGEVAAFAIEQDKHKVTLNYPMPKLVQDALTKENLVAAFEQLTASRKKDILRYFSMIKTEETTLRNLEKLITQLKENKNNVRIP